MCENNEAQAAAFLEQAALHQPKLTAYACSLTKDADQAHDLYADTLLKCHERITSHGFFGASYLPYLITAIKLNFYYLRRDAVPHVSIEQLHNAKAETESEPEHQARITLYTGIMTFIAAHYSADEAAVFELHVRGETDVEIGFLTGLTKWQVRRIRIRIKKNIRKTFGHHL